MSTWDTSTLGELCEISIGKTPPRAERHYWGGDRPWLSIADMNQGRDLTRTKECVTQSATEGPSGRLVTPDTLLLSFKLSVGKIGFARIAMYTNEAIAALPIKDKSRVDSGYLYWALKRADLVRDADDAAMGKNLNMKKLASIELPLPPLPEQKRIGAVLDRLEDLRAKRRRAIALLDDLTQSIFLDMFGERSAVEQTVTLDTILEKKLSNGISPSSQGTVESKVLTLSAVTRGEFDSAAWKVGRFIQDPTDAYAVTENLFLVCRGNGNRELVGRGVFPESDMIDTAYPDTVLAAPIRPDLITREYLTHVWASRAVRSQIESAARTTNGTYKVNQKTMGAVCFRLPSLDDQRAFGRKVSEIRAQRRAHACHLAALDELFTSLQHRAFSGTLWDHEAAA
ncbi:restriction endonuclease subunit S [Streptomyces sp. NPDC090023]|uniref:restriction endonuclease subunit S n=1 Tax=unclassified Streptomyces TaxID=2593676 RepID=UPI0038158BAE